MSAAIRVALLTDSDVYAGTEAHVLTLARGLKHLGIAAAIACPEPSPLAQKALEAGLTVYATAKHGLVDRTAIENLAGLLRSDTVNIVHTHNGRTHFNAALAIRRAGRGHLVATQHFISPNHTTQRGVKGWLYGCAHRWVNRQTAHFVAISQAVSDGMTGRHEAPADRITIVPNGIDAPEAGTLKSPAEVRSEFGMAADAPLIVCTARLELEKDVATLLSAMRHVISAFPTARCLVAGEGSQRSALEEQIRGLALDSSVQLLGFRRDALALIRAADVFVLPSRAEPFGLVILEAMALGRPVVATCAGGPLEIVEDGKTGLLARPADPPSLAAALVRLLSCPEQAVQLGLAGRGRYEARYQAGQMAETTRQVYLRALEEGRA